MKYLLVAALLCVGLQEASADPYKQNTQLIVQSQRLIKNQAKDEDSLKFKHIHTRKTKEFGEVACGYVNGKNSYGGYTGYKRFISNTKTLFIEGHNDSSIPFRKMWAKAC
jgi:hypothetical protein